jgi:hypothetical protein
VRSRLRRQAGERGINVVMGWLLAAWDHHRRNRASTRWEASSIA